MGSEGRKIAAAAGSRRHALSGGVPEARSEQEGDNREAGYPGLAGARPMKMKVAVPRRPVGPLGGPCCARQTGYRNVLYEASWTAAEPPRSPRPLAVRRKSTTAVTGCRGRRAVGPRTTVAVKPSRAAMTRTDARRCWSTRLRLREEKSRVRVRTRDAAFSSARRVVLRPRVRLRVVRDRCRRGRRIASRPRSRGGLLAPR